GGGAAGRVPAPGTGPLQHRRGGRPGAPGAGRAVSARLNLPSARHPRPLSRPPRRTIPQILSAGPAACDEWGGGAVREAGYLATLPPRHLTPRPAGSSWSNL